MGKRSRVTVGRGMGAGWRRALGVVFLLPLALPACDQLLIVDVPSDVDALTLDDPSMAAVLVHGVVADFECAFANYAFLSGTLGDEFMNAGSLQSYNPYDARILPPNWGSFSNSGCQSLGGLYTPLATARFVADDTYRRLSEWTDGQVPNRASHLATTAAYAGYALALFGEGFCQTAIDLGPAMDPPDVFREAETRFTRAIDHAQAANNAEVLGMARVGRARVRLNLGDLSGAASDARLVPEGFRKDARYSGLNPRTENEMFVRTWRERHGSIAPDFWDVEWKGVPDPRVDVIDAERRGLDELTPLRVPGMYPSESSPIPLATWEEAQLIVAEAEGGQTAVDIINTLHARHDLPGFDPATDGDVMEHLVHEARRRQLFLQSHRLGDMRRYGLPFPTGAHPWKGVEYGSVECFPLPDVERFNNPNIPS
jgi:starch-binding outer membrane protein, SusD/RagB family